MENKRYYNVNNALRAAFVETQTNEEAIITTDNRNGRLVFGFEFNERVREANIMFSKLTDGEANHCCDLGELLLLQNKYIKMIKDAKGEN